jgi:hypothetical protein
MLSDYNYKDDVGIHLTAQIPSARDLLGVQGKEELGFRHWVFRTSGDPVG